MSDLYRVECELEVEIGGTRFHAASFHSNWSINEIPTAVCVLAVGRDAADGSTPAKIHSKINSLGKMVTAKVYFQGTGQWSNISDWPNKEVLIFEGRLTGLGIQKVRGRIQVTAHLVHWLADLNFSSSLSSQTHPNNPSQYTFQAVVGSAIKSGVALAGFGIGQSSEIESVTPKTVSDDLWGKAIKPLFCALSEARHIRITGELSNCADLKAGGNEQALAALRRIEGESGDSCSKRLSCYTPKLSMNLPGGGAGPALGYAISQMLRQDSIESFAYTTLWGKLVSAYASALMFSVVPLVNTALVVPFLPGTRDTYCKEIEADDYDHIDLSASVIRPIRAVAVYNGKESVTGVFAQKGAGEIIGLGGCFQPKDAEDGGMIFVIPTPGWLSKVASSGTSPLRTTGVGGGLPTSSATTPTDGDKADIKGSREGKLREEILRDTAEIYDRYAQSIYVSESIRGRVGSLAGKLRFDIAPGATVRVEGTAEQFLEGKDDLSQSRVACVARVAIGINAEGSKAGTGFQLSHVRTVAENKDDKTSIDQHPLYTTIFKGAPLVDKLLFPEGRNCSVNPEGDQTACLQRPERF